VDREVHGLVLMLGTLSNEARILRGLNLLNCPPTNFAKLAGIPKTRFLQGLNGEPGRAFSDEDAQRYLSFIEKLFELQVAVDELAKDANGKVKHLPLDWSRFNEIGDALVIRLAQQVCLETGDHQLDEVAARALKATRSQPAAQ
jgi:hypothetical protein